MRSEMTDDPAGYYARLEVDPTASQEAIAAAFRRKAREVHPDVAGTGNTDAFMRMKASYDVLSDAGRRAAYDRLPPAPRHRRRPTLPWRNRWFVVRGSPICRSRSGPGSAGCSALRR